MIEYAAIEERVPDFKFDSLNGWAPLQGEGVYKDGQYFYFRFRYDYASLQVWAKGADDMKEQPELVSFIYDVTGDEYAGAIEGDELVTTFVTLVEKLAPHDPETNPSGVERVQKAIDILHDAWDASDV